MDSTSSTTTTPGPAWHGLEPSPAPRQQEVADPPAVGQATGLPAEPPALLPAQRSQGSAHARPRPALWAAAALVAVAAVGAWLVLPRDGAPEASSVEAAPSASAASASASGGTGTTSASASGGTVGGGDSTATGNAPALPETGTITAVASLTGTARAVAPSTSAPAVDASGAPTSYEAANLLDGDPTTCWRMDGDGSGAVLDLVLGRPRTVSRVGLVNGYAKVDPVSGADRYAEERRITRVTWTVGDQVVVQDLTDGTRSAQTVAVRPTSTDHVSVRIESTTPPGDPAFDKTAISDITLLGS